MSLTKGSWVVNTIQSLADRVVGSATALKVAFDKAASDIKTYINDTLTVEVDALDAANVKKTGDQTIAGVKTFSSSPIVPTPTTDYQAATKKYGDDLDTAQTGALTTHKSSNDHDGRYYTESELNAGQLDSRYYTETEVDAFAVKLTGNQTVAGIKSFSSSPIVPTPSAATDAANKTYVDSQAPLTIPNDSLTELKMANEMKKDIAGGVLGYDDYTTHLGHLPVDVKDPGNGLTAAVGDGVTDDTAALQAIITYVSTNGLIAYMPKGNYKITSKLTLPIGTKLHGAGIDNTVIVASITGDIAMEVTNGAASILDIELKDFKVLGNATSSTASSATGGIKFNMSNYGVVERVACFNFASGGWQTAGNMATELRYGFLISGTVGMTFKDCYAQYNDVGFYVEHGGSSVNTTTLFLACTSSINRTHAIKYDNTMTTRWSGGVVESNNGLITIYCKNDSGSGGDTGNVFEYIHGEDNQRIITPGYSGSRFIYYEGKQYSDPYFEKIQDSTGQYCIELKNCRGATIVCCYLGSAASPATGLLLNTTCSNTQIIGGNNNTITNNGVNTKSFYGIMMIGDGTGTLSDASNVAGTTYGKLIGGTINSFTYGTGGQILILEAAAYSCLSSVTNFLLKNGATSMYFALGSMIMLRKDVTSGAWVMIGHMPTQIKKNLTNAASQYIDDREIYTIGDTNSTAIDILNGGHEGQVITIISKHTGVNTTLVRKDVGAGNLRLASDFTMGIHDTLTMRYCVTAGKWYELCRSAN